MPAEALSVVACVVAASAILVDMTGGPSIWPDFKSSRRPRSTPERAGSPG